MACMMNVEVQMVCQRSATQGHMSTELVHPTIRTFDRWMYKRSATDFTNPFVAISAQNLSCQYG